MKGATGILAVVLAGVWAAGTARGDSLVLKGGKVESGAFKEFRQGHITLDAEDGRKINATGLTVESLTVDPPAAVEIKARGQVKRAGLRLTGLHDGQFVFEDGGSELKLSPSHVEWIRTVLDFQRSLVRAEAADDTLDGRLVEVNIEELVEPGRVTVVHIHRADVVSSVRQGNYLQALRAKFKTLNIVKIEVGNWESPTAVKYGITSAPQFWFYGADGKLRSNLTERFTEADMDAALAAARR